MRRLVWVILALGLWSLMTGGDAAPLRRHMAVIGGIGGGGGPPPSGSGALPAFTFQNPSGSVDQSSGWITWAQPLKKGAVFPADSVMMTISGQNYYVQKDNRSTWGDGSVRHAVFSMRTPAIGHNASISGQLAIGAGTVNTPAASPPSISALQTYLASHDVEVDFTFYFPGSTVSTSIKASDALSASNGGANGGVATFLSGTGVKEYDYYSVVAPASTKGGLRVWFNTRAYGNNLLDVDVVLDNRWWQTNHSALKYDITIKRDGSTVYTASNVQHYLWSQWHKKLYDSGVLNATQPWAATPQVINIQFDRDYFIGARAALPYDMSIPITSSQYTGPYASIPGGGRAPLNSSFISTVMSAQGGRQDLGPMTGWEQWWLSSQDYRAFGVMMDVADAGAGIPWHWIDETTVKPLNYVAYSGSPPLTQMVAPSIWNATLSWSAGTATVVTNAINTTFGSGCDNVGNFHSINVASSPVTGYNGNYQATVTVKGAGCTMTFPLANPGGNDSSGQAVITFDTNPWFPDAEHAPEIAAIPYMVTGDKVYLDVLQGQAVGHLLGGVSDYWTATDNGLPVGSGGTRLGIAALTSTRTNAWIGRDYFYTALYTPDTDSMKSFFTSELAVGINGQNKFFVQDNIDGHSHLETDGWIPGGVIGGAGDFQVQLYWMDYMLKYWGLVAMADIPAVPAVSATAPSAQALALLKWNNNFQAGTLLNGLEDGSIGYNPKIAGPYLIWADEPWNKIFSGHVHYYSTWDELYTKNRSGTVLQGSDPNNPTGGVYGDGTNWITNATQGGVPFRTYTYPVGAEIQTAGCDAFTEGGSMHGYIDLRRGSQAVIMSATALDAAGGHVLDPTALHAFGYSAKLIAEAYKIFCGTQAAETTNYGLQQAQTDFAPLLPDGVKLSRDKWNVDTTGSTSTMTAAAGLDQLLAIRGSQTATLTGSNGCFTLLYGDAGTATLDAGAAGTCVISGYTGPTKYLIGGHGATTFIDNQNNGYYKSGYLALAANYKFRVDGSGRDEIVNFRPGTDTLTIKQNLNGNGITTAAGIVAASTVVNGNTVIDLGASNKITLDGITVPSSIQSSITMCTGSC